MNSKLREDGPYANSLWLTMHCYIYMILLFFFLFSLFELLSYFSIEDFIHGKLTEIRAKKGKGKGRGRVFESWKVKGKRKNFLRCSL